MSRQAKPKTPPSLLEEPWRYSYVSRPVCWAVAVWLAAVAVHALDLRVLWVALAAAGLAVLGPVGPMSVDAPLRTRWFGFFLATAIGAYVTWCTVGTPLSRDAGLALIPGAGLFGVWWHWIVAHHDNARDAELLAQSQLERDAATGDFPRILANAGFRGIKPGPVERFEAGTQQLLTLPANGSVTFKSLHAATEKIEIAARAKFPIRFMPGPSKAEVFVLQLDRDVLAETQPYPVDRSPRSIHQPITLGMDELGVVQVVTMRELSAMFVGERGSGKSNLINIHLAHLTGCTDALVWMIDGKGGRTARPWLEPFLQGIGKPALDWCAITPEEADAMLLAARAAIEIRSRGAGEKVHPNPGQPAIILIVEEASLVTGTGDLANTKRAGLAKQVIVLGRSEAVDGILVGQRGTVTMLGSGDMKSQLQYVVGLGVSKMEDAQRIFGDVVMAREALRYAGDPAYKGVMLAKAPGWSSVLPVKSWYLDPAAIFGVAQTNAQHRAELDRETADYVHDVLVRAGIKGGYVERWDRFTAAMAGTARGAVSAASGGTGETAGAAVSGGAAGTGGETAGARRGADIVERAREAARAKAERSEFEQLIAASWNADTPDDVPPEERDDPDVIPPILRHVYAVFTGRDEDRLPTQVILDHLPGEVPLTATKLGRLMNHCGVTSIENVLNAEGKRVRGYAFADVARAFTRARDTGGMPMQAFDWEP